MVGIFRFASAVAASESARLEAREIGLPIE
ncbi:hypothetical protein EEDFHM_02392 [Methylorubrum populi]